jgi:hypothetical protein
MMDSFVEVQNRLKRMSYRGAVTLFKNAAKPRSSLLVHTCGREVTGLKTYRGPKRKDQLGVQHGRGSGVAVSVVRGRKRDSKGRAVRRLSSHSLVCSEGPQASPAPTRRTLISEEMFELHQYRSYHRAIAATWIHSTLHDVAFTVSHYRNSGHVP